MITTGEHKVDKLPLKELLVTGGVCCMYSCEGFTGVRGGHPG